MVAPPFHAREAFAPAGGYRLLPMRFLRLDDARYVLTNDAGEHLLLPRDALVDLVEHRLLPTSPIYRTLQAKHLLFDSTSDVALELLAVKQRTRADRIAEFTGLHIFVVTLRCEHSCQYCQVSRRSTDEGAFDMRWEHAELALEHVFRSPSRAIKIEMQGGEPLLAFPLVRRIVERAEAMNLAHGKDLAFVIATNLALLDDEMLEFCAAHRVHLSTSLDGPADLHDRQRHREGGGSHAAAVASIARARERVGSDGVSALMTTTAASLPRVEEIVDEYVRLGFSSIFLRSLSPYGFAAKSLVRRYDANAWLSFYRRGLAHVLALNARGVPFREEFTAILLRKIEQVEGTSYVDLQSPAGIGIAGIVYNYDGSVYASDEGRMLAEMGDTSFRIGHLGCDSYEAMMTSDALLGPLADTILEGSPQCSDCAFLPYCGADPVGHRATEGDWLGHKAFSDFCTKQMGALTHLLGLLHDDTQAREVLLQWL